MNTKSFTRRLTVVAVLCAAAPVAPTSAGAQEDTRISQCICKTTTRTEPVTVFGIQIGTRTITESQCWYEPG